MSFLYIYLPINTVWAFEGFLRVMDSEMSFQVSFPYIYLPINTVWTFEGFLRVMDSEMSFQVSFPYIYLPINTVWTFEGFTVYVRKAHLKRHLRIHDPEMSF